MYSGDPSFDTNPYALARYNDSNGIVALLDEGTFEVNTKDERGYSALTWACRSGWVKTATMLLERGADVEAQAIAGMRPMHYACQNDHEPIVHLLISKGRMRT